MTVTPLKTFPTHSHTYTYTGTHTHTHTHIYIYIYIYIYNDPSTGVGRNTSLIFKRSLTDLNSEFSFSLSGYLTQAKKYILPYYLPRAGGRIIGFILSPRVFVLCEMKTALPRFWTLFDVSISNDDDHYTTANSNMYVCMYECMCMCLLLSNSPSFEHVWLNNKVTFCLNNFLRIISSFLTNDLVLGWSW